MSFSDLLLQQTINGLSLGAMYSLLALGFTLKLYETFQVEPDSKET